MLVHPGYFFDLAGRHVPRREPAPTRATVSPRRCAGWSRWWAQPRDNAACSRAWLWSRRQSACSRPRDPTTAARRRARSTDALGAHLPGIGAPPRADRSARRRCGSRWRPIASGVTRLDLTEFGRRDAPAPDAVADGAGARGPDCAGAGRDGRAHRRTLLARGRATTCRRCSRRPRRPRRPRRRPPVHRESRPPPAAAARSRPGPWRWSAAVAAAGRAGDGGSASTPRRCSPSAIERRSACGSAAGSSNGDQRVTSSVGDASFRRFPLRLGGYLPLPPRSRAAGTRPRPRSGRDLGRARPATAPRSRG